MKSNWRLVTGCLGNIQTYLSWALILEVLSGVWMLLLAFWRSILRLWWILLREWGSLSIKVSAIGRKSGTLC